MMKNKDFWSVSIPEKGVIPFEEDGARTRHHHGSVSIPEKGVIPFEGIYLKNKKKKSKLVSIPEKGVIPFEG